MLGNLGEFGICSWEIKTIDMVREQCEKLFDFVSREIVGGGVDYSESMPVIIELEPDGINVNSYFAFLLVHCLARPAAVISIVFITSFGEPRGMLSSTEVFRRLPSRLSFEGEYPRMY